MAKRPTPGRTGAGSEAEETAHYVVATVARTADLDARDSADVGVAQRLREARLQCGLSQAELAAAMADQGHPWHQTTVARTEAATREPRFSELKALAAATGVDLRGLLGIGPSEPGKITGLRAELQSLKQEDQLVCVFLTRVTREIAHLETQKTELETRRQDLERKLQRTAEAYRAACTT